MVPSSPDEEYLAQRPKHTIDCDTISANQLLEVLQKFKIFGSVIRPGNLGNTIDIDGRPPDLGVDHYSSAGFFHSDVGNNACACENTMG